MKMLNSLALISVLAVSNLMSQQTEMPPRTQDSQAPEAEARQASPTAESGNVEQLRSDVQRLRALLNQMRNNLAFVQTSQTPLKHQFELEADAWQVIVDQMDRRLRALEDRAKTTGPPQK